MHASPAERSAIASAESRLGAKQLRHALGKFATGVAIVTARGRDHRNVGLTVNSFSSVSLSPPLVLWSLANRSESLSQFREATHFAIHVLSDQQRPLAERFASNVPERFAGMDVVEGPGHAPLLQGCAVRFICRTVSATEAGDHHIFLGEVIDLQEGDATAGSLLFYRGEFQTCAPAVQRAPTP